MTNPDGGERFALDALQDALEEQNRLIRVLIVVVGMLVLILGVVVAV